MDQLRGPISATKGGEIKKYADSPALLAEICHPIRTLHESHSACGANMIIREKQISNDPRFIKTEHPAFSVG